MRIGARPRRVSGRAATADNLRPRYMDSFNAITGWQANLAGTALAAGRNMGDALRVACFGFGTVMFVSGMVLAVW